MPSTPIIYPSSDSDNARWLGFEHRPGDIVISTRSKSGTTWMQMICALLVFQTPDLPAPLWQLSPWLDWLITPLPDVEAHLAAQTHRRFIKTHTPLNGLPLHPDVTYIVVARHPLDAAVSFYHHIDNLDRERLRELTGQTDDPAPTAPRPELAEWIHRWITWEGTADQELDSLPGFMMHLSDAWSRREEPNVVLVHFDDLIADLEGEMRRLASILGIDIEGDLWPELVEAATFQQMRARADNMAPATGGIIVDNQQFFREGIAGARHDLVKAADVRRYLDRARQLAPADLLEWLHQGG